MLFPLKLEPQFREYIWGGNRLRPNKDKTAEAWSVYEENKILEGQYAGSTLADLAEKYAFELLGRKVIAQTGTRFPLLIKLLD